MSEEVPWQPWLEQLVRLHVALDKVGSSMFPSEIAHDYIKVLLFEIFRIYDKVDAYVLENPDTHISSSIDEAVLKIIKTSVGHHSEFASAAIYDEFNDTVKNYIKKLLTNKEFFVPKSVIWSSSTENPNALGLSVSFEGDSGAFFEWHDNGAIKAIGSFDNSGPTGVWASFNRRGKLMSRFDHKKHQELKKREKMVESYKSNISFAKPERPAQEEGLGFGAAIFGSLAALTLTSLFKKKKTNKAVIKHEQDEKIQVEV